MVKSQATALRRNLLRWYDRHRRELPWRNSRDPYRIWISEVMLQQTRVQAVIPYYEKFLRLFPDIRTLAAAEEQSLLACWSGLGYYSRARNLRRAAQQMMREWNGEFPREYAAARRLPGVGDYTARAVLSIAYGIPLAVLDGNVARVLSRLYALKEDPRSHRGKQKYVERADALLARRRPGDFNQAMMELGATVCLPGAPRCEVCPLRRHCLAYTRDQVAKFPLPRRAAKPKVRRFVAALIRDAAGRCLLIQRPRSAKRMGGFWELPMWEEDSLEHSPLPSASLPSTALPSTTLRTGRTGRAGDSPRIPHDGIVLEELLGRVRHSITSNQFEINVHTGRFEGRNLPPRAMWVSPSRMGRLPITTITRKALSLRPSRAPGSGAKPLGQTA